jgi:hypothetical protein
MWQHVCAEHFAVLFTGQKLKVKNEESSMQNQTPNRSGQKNESMSEHDKQKTVSNPSPGSSDPGADDSPHDGRAKESRKRS